MFTPYFNFTKPERIALAVLIGLALVLIGVLFALPHIYKPEPLAAEPTWQVLDKKVTENKGKRYASASTTNAYNEEDEEVSIVDNSAQNNNNKQITNPYPLTPKPLQDITVADSVALLNVDGIGPVFAGRIVKYRNLLGGYHSVSQIGEVYGIDAEKFAFIKKGISVGKGAVSQLNINTVTFKSLMRHPYIGKEKTKAIFDLKKKLGNFTTPNQLVEAGVFTPSEFEKVAPYLTAE